MLKFNLTQEGKGLIVALQNNDKLTITHVRLWNNSNGQQVDLPVRSGAVVIDGTCNGPYVVVDVNDASDKNYQSDDVALLSGASEVATLYKDANASGYEAVLTCSLQGRNAYPSIKYRTQTWASGKIPTSINIMKGSGDECDVILSFGGKGGDPSDPSSQSATAHITIGDNFPKTITFSNGDILETYDTVSAAGVKSNDSYDASTEMGENAIRPLYSKISIQKESNKQLKLRLSCQFDGAEKCKFNTTSINLPYASRFREGVVRFTDTSNPWISDGQRYNTVYSAADVDAKISQVTESLGNLDQYAKKAEQNEFTAANTFTAGITVNGEIGGTAVTDAGTGGDKHIVNVGYADNKYLSKTDASATYLTQTNADATYLTKTDANTAAGNYAKLNENNEFNAGTTNTFNGDVTVKGIFAVGESQNAAEFAVTSTGISGTLVNNDKVSSPDSNLLPTEGAVKSALNDVESALTQKDNDLQSQIDGINAGQNLADIVNNTTELAAYDVSHLKAKGDSLPGKPSTPLTIGDKVQVLGGGNVQSSVYELIKGTKPEGETNSIVSNTDGYYWHYIGVYGTNAYTKSEIDAKVSEINTNIGKKADQTYVDTALAKKVDKTQITTTISGDTATNENIPSASAVKTYVDGVANNLPNKYVTLDTEQKITGAKTFANGNITIANPNDGHKDKHYVWVTASGDNTTDDYTSSVTHWDLTHNDVASDQFMRPRGAGDNVFHTNDLTRLSPEGEVQQYTKLEQHISNRYNYKASDMYMTTSLVDMKVAQIGTPGNTASTDDSLKENYVERIRIRKNTSTATSPEGGFLPAGQSVTDIDLFADNINNVFNNEVSFRVCTTSGEDKTDTSVLEIRGTGVYYHTTEGSSISTTEYQLRTAGSLDFTTSMSALVGSDSFVPTTKAVADFVDNKISGITGGTAFVKTSAQGTNQKIDSAITVTEGVTVGSNDKVANLDVTGIITGNAVATRGLESNGTRLPTESAVVSFVNDKLIENRSDISDNTKVGAMGLFLYTGGDLKEMGAEVAGTSLQAVGMQLPMDGVVSWSQGAAMAGRWKLLNNTIAGEPCLVLAIRVG